MRIARSEGMSWGAWVAIGLGTLAILAGVGLSIYGSSVHPRMHEIKQVLSNDRFPA